MASGQGRVKPANKYSDTAKLTALSINFGISPTAGGLGLGRGGLELKLHEVPTTDSSQVPRVQVQVPKSNEAKPSWTCGLGLGRGGLELKLHEEESKYTEA